MLTKSGIFYTEKKVNKPGFVDWVSYSRYYGDFTLPEWEGQALFISNAPLFYITNDGAEYEVPENTISNLGSIPRILWPIFPRDEFPSSYFLHDYLCGKPEWIKRKDADKVLREAVINSFAPKWKANVIYQGVRIGDNWGKLKWWNK